MAKRRHRVFRRRGRFYRDHFVFVFRIDALPPLATNAGETYSAGDRSRRNFPAHRRNVHAFRSRTSARRGRLDHTGARMGDRDFWRRFKNNARCSSTHKARDVPLSRHGLVDADVPSDSGPACSDRDANMACFGRRHLHLRRDLFRERTNTLLSFRLALVRAWRNELPFPRGALLRVQGLTSCGKVMIPIEHDDPINAKILAVSEDKIEGFVREPFQEIAQRCDVPVETVMERIAAMLRAGTIRRVRQTLLATNLADGALVAWKVAPEKIDAAFDFMFQRDPFSGHVVLRSTDTVTAGSEYKLWTTVKVPHGSSLQHHGEILAAKSRRRTFSAHAGEGNFHARRWSRAAKND